MNTYKIKINPDIRYAVSSVEPTLTKEMLEEAIPGMAVRAMTDRQWGPRVIDVQLDRPTHEQALEDIVWAVQCFGFSLAEAVVSEWSDNATEGAIRSVVGDTAMEDPVVAFFVAGIAYVVGLFVNSEERKLEARYGAYRFYYGWTLTEIPQQQSSVKGLQPGFAAS